MTIELITGSMFSGKTTELIRRVNRARYANKTVKIYKHALDVRYHEDEVVSHDNESWKAQPVSSPTEIKGDAEVIAIDEVQFFDEDLISIVEKLSKDGHRVYIAGLDQDYFGNSFGPMGELMARADKVDKLSAVCVCCGEEATKSYRKPDKNPGDQVVVGGQEMYEARCKRCYYEGLDETRRKLFPHEQEQNIPTLAFILDNTDDISWLYHSTMNEFYSVVGSYEEEDNVSLYEFVKYLSLIAAEDKSEELNVMEKIATVLLNEFTPETSVHLTGAMFAPFLGKKFESEIILEATKMLCYPPFFVLSYGLMWYDIHDNPCEVEISSGVPITKETGDAVPFEECSHYFSTTEKYRKLSFLYRKYLKFKKSCYM